MIDRTSILRYFDKLSTGKLSTGKLSTGFKRFKIIVKTPNFVSINTLQYKYKYSLSLSANLI